MITVTLGIVPWLYSESEGGPQGDLFSFYPVSADPIRFSAAGHRDFENRVSSGPRAFPEGLSEERQRVARGFKDAPGHGGMRVFTAGMLEGDCARAGMVIHRMILTADFRVLP
jgi:hypothetical protein